MSKSKLLALEGAATQPKQKQEAVPEPPPFTAPHAALGQSVIWYVDRWRNNPHVGIVTGVTGNMIDCNVIAPNQYAFQPHTGVLHADDPHKEAIDGAGEGCWEHTPATLQLIEAIEGLTAAVDALSEQNATMAKQIAGLKGRREKPTN